MNVLRTVFLLTILTLVFVFVGNLVGGRTGMIVALVIGLAFNFLNYWFSASMVLKVYGARILEPDGLPWLQEDVRLLAQRAGIPMPRIAIVENPAPNAFATGRNPANAVVAVTTGLLGILDRRQVRAVIGHELGHVRNRDMLTMTLVSGAVSAISVLGYMAMWGGRGRDRGDNAIALIVGLIVAPLVATLVQAAISRTREYAADDAGGSLSGDPRALAEALEALHRNIPRQAPLSATGATAHMMIANPFFGIRGEWFSSHPDPMKRIARLRAMAGGA